MDFKSSIFATYILLCMDWALAEDLPCAARQTEYGYVCVCNASYCDTVERPPQLPRGSFYLYSTSKDSPGFTRSIGSTINTTSYEESSDVYFWVNSSVQFQMFHGIGAGLSDSAGYNFNSLPTPAQQKFAESYFGVTGLEYVFGRVPIASADFSLESYTYDDVAGDVELVHFNLTHNDYDYKFPLMKAAVNASARGVKFIATPWTAPSWMKTNNNYIPGYILNRYLYSWAKYLVKFLEAYKENGLEFWGLSQGNELILGLVFHFRMANVIMLPNQLRLWTKEFLGPMVRESHFHDIKILTLDDERPMSTWWMNRVLGDEEVRGYVDGLALHWYLDSGSNTDKLEQIHAQFPDKLLLYTESSLSASRRGNAVELGKWDVAVRYINDIFQNFNNWVNGYVDWNIVLNLQGGPTLMGLTLDAATIVNASAGEFYKQPAFYALGHFSKFLPPGSVRVDVTSNQNISETHEDESLNGEIWRKMFNSDLNVDNDEPTPPTGQPGPHTGTPPTGRPGPPGSTTPVPGPPQPTVAPSTTLLALAALNPDNSHTVIVYNPRSEAVDVKVVDPEAGTLAASLPANSINTFLYW